MHAELFELVFDGRLLPGRAAAEVKSNLALLFKTSPAQIEALFDGGEKIIKRQLDYTGALRYAAALKQAGALCRIRPMASTAPQPAAAAPVKADIVPAEQTRLASSAFSLAALGTDLLEPVEHAVPPPPDVDHLSVAAPGADLLEGVVKTPPPPPPDTSALSVAAVGADLGQAQRPAAPPPPDTSYLSVAAVGADLAPHAEKRSVAVPDLSHLSLSAAPEESNPS